MAGYLGAPPFGRGFLHSCLAVRLTSPQLGSARGRHWRRAVVATDPVSANADYDNGAALHGSPRYEGRDGDIAPRIDAKPVGQVPVGAGRPTAF